MTTTRHQAIEVIRRTYLPDNTRQLRQHARQAVSMTEDCCFLARPEPCPCAATKPLPTRPLASSVMTAS